MNLHNPPARTIRAVHGEEAYPSDELASTTAASVADETPAKNEKVPEMATSGSADHT